MSTFKHRAFFKKALKDQVDYASNLDNLVCIMRKIPMDRIKSFIKENVDEFDESTCRNTWYNETSIREIFPSDVNQHILSFLTFDIDSAEVKTVCKTWNELSHQNEFNYYRNLQKSLDENECIQYNQKKNKIWIVDAKRRHLTQAEKKLNFNGPIAQIMDVKSGDGCFVHGAIDMDDVECPLKASAVIGIGHSAKIIERGSGMDICLYIEQNMHFENMELSLPFSDSADGTIHIDDSCKLSMKDCHLSLGGFCGIACRVKSCLTVDNCVFDGASTAIYISPFSNNVAVENCVFKHCGKEHMFVYSSENACILIDDNNWSDLNESGANSNKCQVKLSCIGNVFEDNLCYPIAERNLLYNEDGPIYIPTNLYALKGNVLKGFNGLELNKKITDANKLYFNDEQFKIDLDDS